MLWWSVLIFYAVKMWKTTFYSIGMGNIERQKFYCHRCGTLSLFMYLLDINDLWEYYSSFNNKVAGSLQLLWTGYDHGVYYYAKSIITAKNNIMITHIQ